VNSGTAPGPLRVGGVPEHLNLPWYRFVESGGLPRTAWVDQPGGTGQMMQGLADGTLDAAVVLTEGAVAAIAGGNPARIVSCYLGSPLRWGVHVAAESRFDDEASLADARFAISRPGSGSQLMAHVLADRLGFTVPADRFVEVGSLDGARAALADGRADAFLWDRYMTSPLVAAGEWRRVGEQPTPWPAFVVVATPEARAERMDDLWEALHRVWDEARNIMTDPDAVTEIAGRFGLPVEETATWFDSVRWEDPEPVEPEVIDGVVAVLRRVGVLDRVVDAAEVLA
jgi:ABC-type nitrate/sulfonate/bicarbonate transport system substrate-binding protein